MENNLGEQKDLKHILNKHKLSEDKLPIKHLQSREPSSLKTPGQPHHLLLFSFLY